MAAQILSGIVVSCKFVQQQGLVDGGAGGDSEEVKK
jgi:hypothetical protein